ncbi:MAG: hypothetical protein ACOY0T_07225 [Myxococcota bacterium]
MKADKEFYGRAVSDTLDSIVSPGVRDTLLAEALTLAGEIVVPSRSREFRAFVRGPLSETLERALGQGLGRSVAAELLRLAATRPPSSAPPKAVEQRHRGRERPSISDAPPEPREAGHLPEHVSGAAPRRKPARADTISTVPPPGVRTATANAPTMPARPRGDGTPREPAREVVDSARARPPVSNDYPAGVARTFGMLSSNPAAAPSGGRKLPTIFVATRDTELVRRFSGWLDPRASVVRVLRLSELLLHVQDGGDRKMVIVVDGHGSPLRIEALAAVAEELPENVSVVLWGGAPELSARLSELFPRVSEWLLCTDHTPLSDVVDRCAEIVG